MSVADTTALIYNQCNNSDSAAGFVRRILTDIDLLDQFVCVINLHFTF